MKKMVWSISFDHVIILLCRWDFIFMRFIDIVVIIKIIIIHFKWRVNKHNFKRSFILICGSKMCISVQHLKLAYFQLILLYVELSRQAGRQNIKSI